MKLPAAPQSIKELERLSVDAKTGRSGNFGARDCSGCQVSGKVGLAG